jgi:splicing factor 3A subunit 3
MFSGEEGYGKYVDLYANHIAYCNLKNIGKRPGYLQYLDTLAVCESQPLHSELSKDTRLSKEYAAYAQVIMTVNLR